MEKTTNYQLNQWDASDRVQRTDFNADNAKIDAALAGKVDFEDLHTLEGQMDQVALTIPKIIFGTYSGDGAASKHIDLGFKPKAVLLFASNGATRHTTSTARETHGGLAFQGCPVENSSHDALVLDDTGFNVFCNSNSSAGVYTNSTSKHYYIAFA